MKTTEFLAICIVICAFVIQVFTVDPCVCQGVQKPYISDMCNCGCIKEVDKGDYVQAGWNSYLTQCNQTLLADLDAQFDKNCPKGEDLNTEDCEYFKNNVTGKLTDLWKHCGDVLDSVRDDCDNCGTNCTRIKPPGQSDD